ncbi:porin family protein [Draconibacterium sp. IB214405]|uniref:porin family protein n=1 Tax=Draconibacterium sp. IB214405 TaxID=3097352 RepID=UPI002A155BB9|nr:porin family protein [Draconibacterium sp. IB214405]MDX8339123.1 porin family protein [Draconibacterium sp. IB214405]
MRIVARLLVMAFFTFLSVDLFAQTIGVKAGYTLSDMMIDEGGSIMTEQLNMRSGFHFGPTFEWGINEGAGIETALIITTKGIKINESESVNDHWYSIPSKVNLWYIDIPVFGKLYTNINALKIYGMLGPYVGVGLSGKIKLENDRKIVWGPDEDDDLHRFGLGLGVGGGLELNSFLFEFTGHFALNNISTKANTDVTMRNRSFMFSLGYKFHK